MLYVGMRSVEDDVCQKGRYMEPGVTVLKLCMCARV